MDNRISTKVKIAKNLMQFFLTRRVFAWRGSSSSHSVAITFDDGPNPQYTPECLNILKKLNVKGTFFIIGQHAEKYPELLQRIFDEGHSLGIHTYSHPFTFHQMKFSEIKEELEKTQNLIFRLTNKRVTLYRPPRGQLSIKLLLSTSILKFPT
ncbi:MAG: polysaccharide deacetylase family protein, partial [Calditrichaeota bacterium]